MTPLIVRDRVIGPGEPTFVVAEMSANHGGSLARALDIVRAAAAAGADAVKIQTYTADTMTLDAPQPWFEIGLGTLWTGRRLHELYREAATPYEWYPPLRELADREGIVLFSAPFDESAVRFLAEHGAPLLKIASFELIDLELIRVAAATGLPLIMSTGMASLAEIDAAVGAARRAGATQLALLRCNSAYPAPVDEMDLRTMQHMHETWGVPVGLSDHTLGATAAIAGVALGASIVEKHITMARAEPTPDAAFSAEPDEFADLVAHVRAAERAVGQVRYGPSARETASLGLRRSLFVVRDVEAGALLTGDDVRSLRPAVGLAPAELANVLGRRARQRIERGTPVTWSLLD